MPDAPGMCQLRQPREEHGAERGSGRRALTKGEERVSNFIVRFHSSNNREGHHRESSNSHDMFWSFLLYIGREAGDENDDQGDAVNGDCHLERASI